MFDSKLEKKLQSAETTEGRRPEVVGADSGAPISGHPTSEVRAEKAKRRNLTIAYKVRVIETLKTLRSDDGGSTIGAYLRKEGLYYSTVRKWEKQYKHGDLTGALSKTKGNPSGSSSKEIKKLRRKLESTEKKLEQSKIIIDIQKKISKLLGIEQPEFDETTYELKSPLSRKKSQ